MMNLYSNVRTTSRIAALAALLLAVGCSTAPLQSSPVRSETVITSVDTARLDSNHHLALDLRADDYEIDTSLGPVDLTYVDIIDLAGRVQPIEQLVSNSEAGGSVTRKDFAAGFSVRASGDQVVLSGHANDSLRIKRCFECVCEENAAGRVVCKCKEVVCSTNAFAPEQL